MQQLNFFPYLILLVVLVQSCASIEDVTPYAPVEMYPTDKTLESLENKRAMIVLAHDDDMCAMSGTISRLNSLGWEIRVISSPNNPGRDAAQIKACTFILDSVLFYRNSLDEIRLDLDTNKAPFRAIDRSLFPKIYKDSGLREEITEQINRFQPSVVFTLDDEMGGYGHPDHIMVSSMVLDLAHSKSIRPQFIYQSVYTDHMENTIMDRHRRRLEQWGLPSDGWEYAKATYGVTGMPTPSVQVNIEAQATSKMNYLCSYNERERKTIGFFIPAFFDYSAADYFKIFDREFFRVLRFD